MAAIGKTPILLYGSTTATNTPSSDNLTNSSDGCEIAINVADKNLFFKDSNNAVNTVPIRQSSGSSDGWLSSANWTTFNSKQAALVSGTNIKTVSGTTLLGSGDLGTIGTGYGGTGLTSFTANGVVYASSTSALATGTALQFDGSNLGINTTPSAWNSGNKALDVGGWGAFATVGGSAMMGFNVYATLTTGGFTYKGSAPSMLYRQTTGGHSWFVAPSGSGGAAITYTQGLGIDTSANVTVSTGNLVIGTSGKGIDFSATAGTGTSELLADYEEGTFTPTIFGTTNAGTGTYTTQAGFYTKIGNRVFFHLNMTWTAHTGTGNSRFGGLPYTSANIAFSGPNCTINPNNYALTANNVMIAVVNGNASTGSIYQMPTGGGAQAEVPLDTVAGVSITGFYQTS